MDDVAEPEPARVMEEIWRLEQATHKGLVRRDGSVLLRVPQYRGRNSASRRTTAGVIRIDSRSSRIGHGQG